MTSRFWTVRRHGSLARGSGLSIWALRNGAEITRVGLRIQKGMRGSVARNRAKRLMREALRSQSTSLEPGWDLVIVITRIQGVSLQELQAELARLLKKLRIGE